MLQYFVGSYPQLLAARVVIDAGSSPQHPLGSSILSRYYPKARGWALTFHHSAGNLGSFIGPALASLALLYMGWRTAFVVFGIFSLAMGLTLFLLRDYTSASDEGEGKKSLFKSNVNAYLLCLKNRKILLTSLVLMVGAAGRGTGVNATYLVPFFMERFNITASSGGMLLTVMMGAGLIGPLAIAWLSDRTGKRIVDHPSDAFVIGNHDCLVCTALPAGFTFLFELDSLWKRRSSARIAHTDHDRRFCQPGAYRRGVFDLLFRRLHLWTDLDFDHRLHDGSFRFYSGLLRRCVHLHRGDALANARERGSRKKRKGLMRRHRQR